MQNIHILCYKIRDFYDIKSKKIYSAMLKGMLKRMNKKHKNIVQNLQHKANN